MIEIIKEMGGKLLTGETGSRKAQALLIGLVVCVGAPEVAWPAMGLTGLYILGRAWHDAALVRAGQ